MIIFQIANFLDDKSSKLAYAEKLILRTSLDVLGNILIWNAAYFNQVKNYFVTNQPK